MSAIDALFQRLRSAGQKAFLPFVTAGDPDLATTAEAIELLAAHGASMCEVGIPYSDPIADGPVIQASYTRALAHKTKLAEILKMLAGVAPSVSCPLVTMVSYAIVFRHGPEKYVADVKAAGASGLIVPDLLIEEAGGLAEICRREDISLIQLVTPTTPRDRALRIAETTTGFIYYVSVTGITGERRDLPPELIDSVGWLRGKTDLPVCIGFGISTPDHVRRIAPVADGVIVGSAIVRRLESTAGSPREKVLGDLGKFADDLVAALNEK